MSIGLGDFDRGTIHSNRPSGKRPPFPWPGQGRPGGGFEPNRGDGFAFPTDYDDIDGGDGIYVENDETVQTIVKATIATLTDAEKEQALVAYYTDLLKSKTKEVRLNDRRQRSESRQRLQEWLKYLLILVSVLLMVSLVAIVGTVIYTSLSSNVMSETGLPAAIISFFSEIMKMLLTGN